MQERTFSNHTQVNSSSTPHSISSYTQRHNVSAAPSVYDTSGNLGYGVGRLLREAFDRLYNGWHHWWYPAPSKEVLAQRRQVAIYRKRLEAAMVQLDLAVEDLRKNPHAKNSLERFEQVVKESEEYLSPAPTEKLRRHQKYLLNQLRTKIKGLKIKRLSETLLTYLPALPSEAIFMTGASDSHFDTKDASDAKGKRSVAAQPASGFQASFDLATLNGNNGFVVNGISGSNYLGWSVSTAGDINGDSKTDLMLGAWGVSSVAGAAYVIFGQSSFPSSLDLTTLNGINGFVVNGIASGNELGFSASTVGDINGDNKTDLVLGAPGVSNFTGAAYVIFGQSSFPSAFNLTTLNGTNGFMVNGISNSDTLGYAVSTAGDVNGDNKTDLVLGAPRYPTGVGAAYVIFGQSRFPASFNLSTLNGTNGFVMNGIVGISGLGWSVSTAGDINGDSKTDLVLGAPGYPTSAGAAYVIFGQSHFPPTFNLTTLNGTNGFVVNGISDDGFLGWSVSTAGDMNGDNKTDLVLGAFGVSGGAGAAYVIFGQSSFPATFNLGALNGTNGFVVNGILRNGYLGGYLGNSVSMAGDINGDNKTDLVLGAPLFSDDAGTAYVIFGQSRFPSVFNLATLNGTNGFVVNGISSGDQLGVSVSTAGDINGDGKADLVLGAYRVSNGAGAAYVIFGNQPPVVTHDPIGTIVGSMVGVLFGLSTLTGLGYGLYRRWSPKSNSTPSPQLNDELKSLVDGNDDSNDPNTDLLIISTKSDMGGASDSSQKYPKQSWDIDHKIKARRLATDKIYELAEATDQDKRKVIEFYQHCPVTGYEIASVQVIYNPDMNQAFSLHVKKLQHRNNNPAFKAKWPTGQENAKEPVESTENTEWRHVVHEQLKAISKPYQDTDYPAVHLVPMWHGTKKGILDSIFKTGYANLATTDAGFFGKGIYSAYEAEYSYRVYAKEGGALIVNWVACFSAYPVIDGDMKKLEGKGNYSNYDAHFIPVVPRDLDNPDEEVYYPMKPYDKHQYIELVVFASEACLPRYLVELQRTLEKPLPLNRNEYRGVFFPSIQKEEKMLVQEEENENLSSKVAEDENEYRGIFFPLGQEKGKATQQESTAENICARLGKLL